MHGLDQYKYRIIDLIITKYRIRLAVVLLIIQWSFKRFHFIYRHLKVLAEVAFLKCRGERIPDDSSRVHE